MASYTTSARSVSRRVFSERTGSLTLEDGRRLMQTHSEIGERILREVAAYEDIARIVRHHHERIDGEGYPDGIRGADMPLLSKVIAVADAYNAMTSNRPYRDAMPTRVARMRLAQAVETQFDTSRSRRIRGDTRCRR